MPETRTSLPRCIAWYEQVKASKSEEAHSSSLWFIGRRSDQAWWIFDFCLGVSFLRTYRKGQVWGTSRYFQPALYSLRTDRPSNWFMASSAVSPDRQKRLLEYPMSVMYIPTTPSRHLQPSAFVAVVGWSYSVHGSHSARCSEEIKKAYQRALPGVEGKYREKEGDQSWIGRQITQGEQTECACFCNTYAGREETSVSNVHMRQTKLLCSRIYLFCRSVPKRHQNCCLSACSPRTCRNDADCPLLATHLQKRRGVHT